MITQQQANDFANEWIEAWNSHDIDKILMHYDDNDIVFRSPFIRLLHDNPSGTLENKSDLREYFSKGLEAYPDLHFELYHVLVGVNSIALVYRSVRNLLAAEVMEINPAGKIINVMVHYPEQ
jgi:hypothetical protein